MRRLPVFLVLDVSDSMIGDPLRYLEQGVDQLIRKLRQDPHALETVYLSVIAFAGQVKTLVPLMDLPTFYPPRLPVGSGTALGKVLEHLMNEIDQQVHPTSKDRKGDWQPLIYLMTDGKPTDDCQQAVEQWKKKYSKHAQVIAIGLGAHVDTTILSQFADHVLSYNGEDESDFTRFIDWMTLSVRSQSIKIQNNENTGTDIISLDKAGDILNLAPNRPASDADFAIFTGRCQQTRHPYLLKYEKVALAGDSMNLPGFTDAPQNTLQDYYRISGCYPVEESYFDWSVSIHELETNLNMNSLLGGASCPHCGNRFALGVCGICNRIFCLDGTGDAECPWCRERMTMEMIDDGDDGVDIVRSMG